MIVKNISLLYNTRTATVLLKALEFLLTIKGKQGGGKEGKKKKSRGRYIPLKLPGAM